MMIFFLLCVAAILLFLISSVVMAPDREYRRASRVGRRNGSAGAKSGAGRRRGHAHDPEDDHDHNDDHEFGADPEAGSVGGWCRSKVSETDDGMVVTVLVILLCLAAMYFLLRGDGHPIRDLAKELNPFADDKNKKGGEKKEEGQNEAKGDLEKFRRAELQHHSVSGSPLQRALAAHALSKK